MVLYENDELTACYSKGWLRKHGIFLEDRVRKVIFRYKKPDLSFFLNKSVKELIAKEVREKRFITKSAYDGEWTKLNMNGHGKYVFSHGVVYEGEMFDGEFHGEGTLTFPQGQIIKGIFHKGSLVSWEFNFKNGFCELEKYCKFPDRRFMVTVNSDFQPPGEEYLTNEQPTRKIPKGHYDVGDGFYNPKTKWIYNAKLHEKYPIQPLVPSSMPLKHIVPIDFEKYRMDSRLFIKQIPLAPVCQNEEFIMEHCRKAWDEPTGYRPDLYEVWLSGRKGEVEEFRKEFAQKGIGESVEETNSLKFLRFFTETMKEDL